MGFPRGAAGPFVLYRLFHPDSTLDSTGLQVFPAFPIIEDRGRLSCLFPAKCQMFEVEIPVGEVIEQLRQIPAACEMFPLGEGVGFHSHVTGTTEVPGEEEQEKSLLPRVDRDWIYLQDNGARCLLYIAEYKAAHKLTDTYLRAGLRPMDMWKEVVQLTKTPTDPEEKLQYKAEQLSCVAVTQAFEYMMKGGLEYGILTNGAIKVMLRIPEDDPATLHYCLIEPKRDTEPDVHGFQYPFTVLACHVGLTLMALHQPQRSQVWRNSCIEQLHRWAVDFDALIQEIPDDERLKSPPASACRGPRYPKNPRSPYLLRNRSAVPRGSGSDTTGPASTDSGSDSDSPPDQPPSSPIQARQKRRRTENRSGPLPPAHNGPPPPLNQYCTQKCLRRLSNRSPLDAAYPNTTIHQEHSDGKCHPINRIELIQKMQHQLKHDPDHGCSPLGKESLHGAIFTLTLHPYGYTFIGKGTTYKSDYEGKIYEHVKHLQGSAVPVYLGDIYLQKSVYYLCPDYVVIHMGLMACGGKDLGADVSTVEIERTRDEINAAGVVSEMSGGSICCGMRRWEGCCTSILGEQKSARGI